MSPAGASACVRLAAESERKTSLTQSAVDTKHTKHTKQKRSSSFFYSLVFQGYDEESSRFLSSRRLLAEPATLRAYCAPNAPPLTAVILLADRFCCVPRIYDIIVKYRVSADAHSGLLLGT